MFTAQRSLSLENSRSLAELYRGEADIDISNLLSDYVHGVI